MRTELGHYLGQPVLIKCLNFTSSAEDLAKNKKALVSEVRSMARLEHPNIVKFMGFYITEEHGLCCISEYMEGKTLRHLLSNKRINLTWEKEKISIAMDICSAIVYMHSLTPRLIHRNIRAEKVLLTNRREAKLSGFGCARDRTFENTMTAGVGEIQWSAPELLQDGEDYDEKVDVYSFGVLLTELDTREVPFEENNNSNTNTRTADLTMKLVTGMLRPTVGPDCPACIKRIVRQCLQHDPALRPTSDKVLEQLREARQELMQVGGATGMIGDPSMRSDERVMLTAEIVDQNASRLVKTLENVLDFDCPKTGAIVANNVDWHGKMSAVDWMRECGRYARVNSMLARDSVKRRLESDHGLSFLEFSYQLFQAYDFLHLRRHHNCYVQIGGSDQWGNIVSGTDMVRKADGKEVYGVTLPLLTTASGEKYGKSAGNAVWLDSEKTSTFEFYQFFMRSEDADLPMLLKTFTYLDLEEIEEILAKHAKEPEKRLGQQVVAEHVTTLVHGSTALNLAQQATKVLFGGSCEGLSANAMLSIEAPKTTLHSHQVFGQKVVDVVGLLDSTKTKAEIRRLIKAGGLYINNIRVETDTALVNMNDAIEGKVLLVRTGKRNYHIIECN
ncbi:tyrosyl-tRNA synthetase [Thraustotheca clavata]|uniref:Tyrosine--tRNA ligase n=1 Tax=Thraustotheca clavata TaxID=74557 RepID=A0A1V9Z361_9STRA|nr:tyrosyl-tRNA synthetase [Thraustotheca clavata]